MKQSTFLVTLSALAMTIPGTARALTYTSDLDVAAGPPVGFGAGDSISSPYNASVEGTLNVTGGTFSPETLTIDPDGLSPTATVNFTGGTITPGGIVVNDNGVLNVSSTAGTGSVANLGQISLTHKLTIASPGTGVYTGGNLTSLEATAPATVLIDATTYEETGILHGNGVVAAETFELSAIIAPGDLGDASTPGVGELTLSVSSPSTDPVDLSNSVILIDVLENTLGDAFEADVLRVDGEIGAGTQLLVNYTFDANDLLSVGDQFLVIDAGGALTSLNGFFIDESDGIVENSQGLLGHFVPVPLNGNIYIELVPEPALAGTLGLILLPLTRRRPSRHR